MIHYFQVNNLILIILVNAASLIAPAWYRFELYRAKRDLNNGIDFNASEIIPNKLYLGNLRDAINLNELKKRNIKYVITIIHGMPNFIKREIYSSGNKSDSGSNNIQNKEHVNNLSIEKELSVDETLKMSDLINNDTTLQSNDTTIPFNDITIQSNDIEANDNQMSTDLKFDSSENNFWWLRVPVMDYEEDSLIPFFDILNEWINNRIVNKLNHQEDHNKLLKAGIKSYPFFLKRIPNQNEDSNVNSSDTETEANELNYLFKSIEPESGAILVHCMQGRSRSGSIVIAYIMWSQKMTYDQAYQYVKLRRSIVQPNATFEKELRQYEFVLRSRGLYNS